MSFIVTADQRMQQKNGIKMVITGPSGIGKTSLVRSLLADLHRLDPADRPALAREIAAELRNLGTLISFALIGFSVYAHKKATTPRKPKKAWLPAFLRTNA